MCLCILTFFLCPVLSICILTLFLCPVLSICILTVLCPVLKGDQSADSITFGINAMKT